MTGYHAWVFPFIALMFHLLVFLRGRWSWRMEARIVAMIMLFWVIEDALCSSSIRLSGGANFHPGTFRGTNIGGWACHWITGSRRRSASFCSRGRILPA